MTPVFGQVSPYTIVKTFSVDGHNYSDLYTALAAAIPTWSDVKVTSTPTPYEYVSQSAGLKDSYSVSESESLAPEPTVEIISSRYFSGEIYSSSISMHFMNNFMTMQSINQRMRGIDLVGYNDAMQQQSQERNVGGLGSTYDAGYGTGGMDTAPYGPGYAPMYNEPYYNGQQGDPQIFNGQQFNGQPMDSTISRGQSNYGDPGTLIYSAWLAGFWGDGKAKEHGNYSGYDPERSGVIFGLDLFGCTDCRSGVFYSYQHDKIKGHTDYYGKSKSDTHLLGLYHHFGDEVINNIITVRGEYSTEDYKRAINTSLLKDSMSSEAKYYLGGVGYERGMHFRFGDAVTLSPYAGLDYSYLYREGFHENSTAGYGLHIKSRSYHSLRSEVGGRADLNMFPGNQQIKIFINGNWTHEFFDYLDGKTQMYYLNNPNASYTMHGNTLGRDWGLIGGGVEWAPIPSFLLFANYDYVINKYLEYTDVLLGGSVRW